MKNNTGNDAEIKLNTLTIKLLKEIITSYGHILYEHKKFAKEIIQTLQSSRRDTITDETVAIELKKSDEYLLLINKLKSIEDTEPIEEWIKREKTQLTRIKNY